ncbi:MAG: bifunctional 2-C-methyl-D-erythritol 4-phosphate cytidylyltransferase/2-C-methyl-D-erythritol 2,4-cyclodiphosphate synthase [Hyphomonadaceae bacterium]|nr:bifunctional 2-C-methyl-D-erythritol 4-phosphate cytidylyltransferase/2-C-methyl-D-erythritol 2,4-cyclodiphosphate synthase [Hyphomonadaceae bacterium]
MKTAALVMAAGRGERAGAESPKQYRALIGRPVLRWSLAALAGRIDRVVAVIDPEWRAAAGAAAEGLAVELVAGGDTRTASVRAGLEALAADAPDVVLIHDAARPGLTGTTIAALLAALEGAPAAAPALRVDDALKRVDGQGAVVGEAQRDGVRRVQTPQAFRYAAIKAAYEALPEDATYEDDLAVARAAGHAIALVPGDLKLMKLTHAEDFAIMEQLMAGVACVGSGFDAHRFGPGDHVTLCGVKIAHTKGVVGHSDADVGWHALTDAILGAIGAGDIGAHFPPSDARWKGAASEIFLAHARDLVSEAGGRIVHVDLTLVCEAPKIAPHREAMRAKTAEVLGLPMARVSVKATTTEKMGFAGREEGLAAQAVATVEMPR